MPDIVFYGCFLRKIQKDLIHRYVMYEYILNKFTIFDTFIKNNITYFIKVDN